MDINAAVNVKSTAETSGRTTTNPEEFLKRISPDTVNVPGQKATRDAAEEEISKKELVETASALNAYMDDLHTSLGFSINDETKELVVNVINRETKEVIKQIPPEELVSIREKMAELAGILLNEKA